MEKYVKQNFKDGNKLKAAELNHIEDGLAKIIEDYSNFEWKPIFTEREIIPRTISNEGSISLQGFFTTEEIYPLKKFIVYFDDIRYEVILGKAEDGFIGAINPETGSGEGLPFYLIINYISPSSKYMNMILWFDDGKEHNIAVYDYQCTKIPFDFMPEAIKIWDSPYQIELNDVHDERVDIAYLFLQKGIPVKAGHSPIIYAHDNDAQEPVIGFIDNNGFNLKAYDYETGEKATFISPLINSELINNSGFLKFVYRPGMGSASNHLEVVDPMIIPSSTEGSKKQFKITVDDSGTISATEIV